MRGCAGRGARGARGGGARGAASSQRSTPSRGTRRRGECALRRARRAPRTPRTPPPAQGRARARPEPRVPLSAAQEGGGGAARGLGGAHVNDEGSAEGAEEPGDARGGLGRRNGVVRSDGGPALRRDGGDERGGRAGGGVGGAPGHELIDGLLRDQHALRRRDAPRAREAVVQRDLGRLRRRCLPVRAGLQCRVGRGGQAGGAPARRGFTSARGRGRGRGRGRAALARVCTCAPSMDTTPRATRSAGSDSTGLMQACSRRPVRIGGGGSNLQRDVSTRERERQGSLAVSTSGDCAERRLSPVTAQ